MRRRNWFLLLLLVPFIALLWPPFYAARAPEMWGIPFFIWYQFLWTILAALITIAVYLVQSRGERE